MNDQYENKQQYSKDEVKEAIKKALAKNEILGHLNNNLLYMQSFEKKELYR